MARPRKNNAEYFSHDTTMRNDRKIKALRGRYGTEGYGVYNMLLEVLTENENFELILDDFELNLLAGDFGIEPPERLKEMIVYMVELRLLILDVENNCYYSEGLKKRLQPMIERRDKKRIWAQNRWPKQDEEEVLDGKNEREQELETPKTIQSKVKKSKVNNIYSEFEFFNDEEFKNLYFEFLDMRKKKKKPATERAEKMLLVKLHKYPIIAAKKMLENAIFGCWTDVYEIQEPNTPEDVQKQNRNKEWEQRVKECGKCKGGYVDKKDAQGNWISGYCECIRGLV